MIYDSSELSCSPPPLDVHGGNLFNVRTLRSLEASQIEKGISIGCDFALYHQGELLVPPAVGLFCLISSCGLFACYSALQVASVLAWVWLAGIFQSFEFGFLGRFVEFHCLRAANFMKLYFP